MHTLDIPLEDDAIARVRIVDRPGSARLILSHGNGFAIDGYRCFWERLAGHFELVLLDQRNHGVNPPSAVAHHTMRNMAHDLRRIRAGLSESLGERTSIGVFHSFSGRIALLDVDDNGCDWDGLVLFDPPTMPRDPVWRAAAATEVSKLVRWARKRRSEFECPEQLASVYREARGHRHWTASAYNDMAKALLQQDGSGWHLRCPPALEAAAYAQNAELELWFDPARITCPLLIVAADPDKPGASALSTINREYAGHFSCEYATIAQSGHMGLIEYPEVAATLVGDFVSKTLDQS